MTKRMEALWRIAGLLYLVLLSIVSPVIGVVVLVWFVVDVIWQLVTGSEGLMASSPGSFVWRLWVHIRQNVEWVVFGRGDWSWMP